MANYARYTIATPCDVDEAASMTTSTQQMNYILLHRLIL